MICDSYFELKIGILVQISRTEAEQSNIDQLNVKMQTGRDVPPFVRGSYRIARDNSSASVLTVGEEEQIKAAITFMPHLETKIPYFLEDKNLSF